MFFKKIKRKEPHAGNTGKGFSIDTSMIKFYEFKEDTGVVEVFVSEKFGAIKDKLDAFAVENISLPRDDWQAPYMEQYFSSDRSTKLCDTYEEPDDDAHDFRIVFFIHFLAEGHVLSTPFGNVTVTGFSELPQEYKKLLDFEEVD